MRYCRESLKFLYTKVTYEFMPDDVAEKSYKCLKENKGCHPIGEKCVWESAEQMKKRVMKVLDKCTKYNTVIVWSMIIFIL